jgi:hypothetical protein
LITKANFEKFASTCLRGVVQTGGIVKNFIHKAVHGGIRWSKFGSYDNVSMLDVNSLYPYAMTLIKPAVLAPIVWNGEPLDSLAYYVIEIEINEIEFPNNQLGGMLAKIHKNGMIDTLDKQTMEDITHYATKFNYSVRRGYYWQRVSEKDQARISEFVKKEFEDKRNAKDEEAKKLAKLKLNSLYGYTLKRGKTKFKDSNSGTLRRSGHLSNWETQLRRNCPLIESVDEVNKTFVVKNTYDNSFNYTAFGVQILSMTHHLMYQMIDRCDRLSIPIYHIYCDSLMVPSDRLDSFSDMLGSELGLLKIEYDCQLAKVVYSGKYQLLLRDGNTIKKGRWSV